MRHLADKIKEDILFATPMNTIGMGDVSIESEPVVVDNKPLKRKKKSKSNKIIIK